MKKAIWVSRRPFKPSPPDPDLVELEMGSALLGIGTDGWYVM